MKFTKAQIRAAVAANALALANIAAVERQPFAPEPLGGQIVPGEIYLANESVFQQQYFDEPLTNYAVGWRDQSGLEDALNFFCPEVSVPRRFTYKEFINIEEFLAEGANDDLRAIGSEFPTVKFTGVETHARTDNRGLRIRVDLDEVADPMSTLAGGLPAYQMRVVEKLKRRLMRNTLRRTITLLTAGAVNTAKTWDTSAGKDPDQDTLTDLVTGTTARGMRSNRVGYGETAWTKRVLSFRAQNTAGGYASASLTPDQVADLLMVDKVAVNKARYSAAGAAMAEIVNNLVLMFYATDGADTEDASNIKRFVSPTDGGGPLRVYVQQVTSKLVDITVEKYELVKVTSTLGLRQFTIS
jgi:hypothetical protein